MSPKTYLIAGMLAICSVVLMCSEAGRAQSPVASTAAPGVSAEFEVATIKPVKEPNPVRKQDRTEGRRYSTRYTTLKDLLMMAYGLDARQISGGPAWIATDEYDIDAVSSEDIHGSDQIWPMLQKLLADRFQLKFHREQKEMSVFVLQVEKNGPKLKTAESNAQHSAGCGQLGICNFSDETLPEFARWMQLFVLDKPVVDKTGISGAFDFKLNWTPDESQFAHSGMQMKPHSDSANAAPELYTAIKEQLGLKLEAQKIPNDVLVIDHVERPSEN